MTKNRTEVADIDRSLYDFTYGEEGFERLDAGISLWSPGCLACWHPE